MNKNKLNVWHIFSLLLLVFDLLFIVYPLFNVLKNSIIIDHQFSLAHFVRFFGDSYYLDTLDRKSTRLNSSHPTTSRMPSSA